MQHLNDIETYEHVSYNPIPVIIESRDGFLKEFKIQLTTAEIAAIKNVYSNKINTFYVLPKIHKCPKINDKVQNTNSYYVEIKFPIDLSSRPIVSQCHFILKPLDILITKLLKPLQTLVRSYIKDSFDFIQKLSKYDTLSNHIFLTFDINSLYTNISYDLGKCAIKFYYSKYKNILNSRFSLKFILKSIKLLLFNNYFTFNKVTYVQKTGTAMGASFSPIYATLAVGYLEETINPDNNFNINCINYFKENFFRFIDDCFIIWKTDLCQPNIVLEKLNSLNPKLIYTMNKSINEIKYLDIKINNNNNKINTDISYKETNNHLYLHFHSYHPRHIKRNIPYCLMYRINKLVSDDLTKKHRFLQIKRHLLKLKYPIKLINNAIKKCYSPHLPKVKPTEKYFNHIIEYNNQIDVGFTKESFENLKSLPTPLVKNINKYNLRNIFTQSNNLIYLLNSYKITDRCVRKCNKINCMLCNELILYKNQITVNDKKVKLNRSVNCKSFNVIYILFCAGCDKFYVGKTEQPLHKRINLHRSQAKKPDPILPVSKHLYQCSNSKFYVSVLQICNNSDNLSSSENFFINYLSPSLNF